MLMPLQPTAATTATATAIPTAAASAAAAAVTLPHLPIVFMAISCVVCCVCGLLEAASSCGSIKIFVASFSSSSLNSSRCKFLAVFCFSARQAVCFVVVVVVVADRAHLPGRGTDCFQSSLQFVVCLNLSQLVPKLLRL